MLRSLGRALPVLAALVASSAPAAAQPSAQAALPLDRFNPSWAGDRFFGVTSPYAAGHLTPHAGLVLSYAHEPLVLVLERPEGEETIGGIVNHQLLMHANATFSLFKRVAINVDLPVALFQQGDDPSFGTTGFISPSGVALGDLRIGLRGRLYGEYEDPFQIAVGGYLWVPTASAEPGEFMGNGDVRGLPQVTIGGVVDRFVYSADVGPDIRSSQTIANVGQGIMLNWGAAAGYLLLEDKTLQLSAEVLGNVVFDDIQKRTTNLELLLGAKYRFLKDFQAGVAAGPGLTAGVGTPDVRAVASLMYTPDQTGPEDSDGDGIVDPMDACPNVPGVASDDPDKNGCPPPADKDKDGILDKDDACPETAGPPSDDPARNGCPDTDKDGILDKDDACPATPGKASADAQLNGCPDTDGDGIFDKQDACPQIKGVANADPDKHGCPPPADKDKDGILDKDDACPQTAGPANADPARNGCPDTDGDGFLDKNDACPKQPGIDHKDPKKRGCPKVVVKDQQIVILERIEFATAKSTIRKNSFDLLDQIAKVFKDNPQILLVEVQGHTDNQGSKAFNKVLSNARANAVRRALIQRGVAGKRMTAKGYGPDKPIASNDTDEGRQENRRVQFNILKQDKAEGTEVKVDNASKTGGVNPKPTQAPAP